MSARLTKDHMRICTTGPCPHHYVARRLYRCRELKCCGQRIKGKCPLGKF